ncbi:MAG TPA: methyltransferase [Leucothrix mucor]|uniref:Methyltransferase n=1 Tax=Leucothrix mucor TaxID=45248 RepID=A0A7V2WV92_LEUMU|nr:methyltransferase [Leucothrix mucor]
MLSIPIISKQLYKPKDKHDLGQAQRLFHGRGHSFAGLEHLVIDWLPPVVLITLYKPEPIEEIKRLVDYLLSLLPNCKSAQLQHRYLSAGPIDIIQGEKIQKLVILEGQNKFHISLGRARNTGLFLDMRNGRSWLEQHAKNKRVLNLFAYTCGFSVSAITGGATSVLNVDMSGAALSVGRENHRLNHHDLNKVRFEKLNIFKSFGRLKKRGPFDLLVCDPPTFQKGSVQIDRDYPKIMRRLNDFMADKSILLLCLNAPDLTIGFIIDNMSLYAPSYIFDKVVNPPKVYRESQNKGLKALLFIRV